MSYDEYTASQTAQQVNQDRIIQLLAESDQRKDYLYRTLFGSKQLPQAVEVIERFGLLGSITNPTRAQTLDRIANMYKYVLISTTSIGGRTMNLLSETRTRHTEAKGVKKQQENNETF
jgi:hypothetical protein